MRKGKKEILLLVTTLLVLFTIVGCDNTKYDNTHASVTLTTSEGKAYVWESVSDKTEALTCKSEITLKKGETAIVRFKCDSCENEQEYEVKEAWSEVLSCDCPKEMDNKGNSKEYTAISISFED